MNRTIFGPEHAAFRDAMRQFYAKEAVPHVSAWAEAGRMPDTFFRTLAATGLFGLEVPEEYGGSGPAGYAFKIIAWEEAARANVGMATPRCHSDIVTPYVLDVGNDDQKRRWLPSMVSGERMTALAITEPGAGSDMAGITTRATRDGDVYRLSGSKTYITGGLVADLVVVVARTSTDQGRRGGLTLLAVDAHRPGFERGRGLKKIGLKTSDTAELFFDDVVVPVGDRIGEEGEAFRYLEANLPRERLAIAAGAVGMAQAAIEDTVAHVKNRTMFGTTLAKMQNTKFVLAEMATKVGAAEAFLDRAVEQFDTGALSAADAAQVKLFCTEVQGEVVDACLQLFGGAGYIEETGIARMYADARVSRIYGGSSEVMKIVISKAMGL